MKLSHWYSVVAHEGCLSGHSVPILGHTTLRRRIKLPMGGIGVDIGIVTGIYTGPGPVLVLGDNTVSGYMD